MLFFYWLFIDDVLIALFTFEDTKSIFIEDYGMSGFLVLYLDKILKI
jgi:hypothetical protein